MGALDEVAPALKADKEVVLAAVAQRGLAVRHAHPDLQDDWEVLLTAVAQDVRVLRVTEWSSNRAFVFTAVRFNGLALETASPQFRAERDVVLAAVAQNGNALQFAAPWLRADAELITFATKRSLGDTFEMLPAPVPRVKFDRSTEREHDISVGCFQALRRRE